jgi:hypothetical protein
MRLKLDVSFAQQAVSAEFVPQSLKPLGARRCALYISLGWGRAPQPLTARFQGDWPQSRQKNERILTKQPPYSPARVPEREQQGFA